MASGDVYQLVDKQSLFGQEVLNVYFYRQAAPVLVGNVPQQLADSFEATVLPDICAIQSDTLTHTELIVTNLYNPAETFTSVISEPGTFVGANNNPPFEAAGFRLVQDNGEIRNGAKRVAGMDESVSNDGVFTDAGFIASLIATGAAMILGIDAGIVSNAFLPVIVKRILDGTEYRLPTNSGEGVIGNIIDALYNAEVTTQTSRKFGRGS